MTAAPDVIQAMRDMFARGFTVVPIRKGTKAPAVAKGENWNRPWAEPEVLAALEHKVDQTHRAAGIGFLGEHNRGIVPLDFDTDEAENWWREQCEADGLDPDDFPTVITPGKADAKHPPPRRPGKHRYVRDVRGTLGNSTGGLPFGIDVRGHGQVLLPPSPHPDGGTYAWAKGRTFGDFEHIPNCPDFVYEAIESAPGTKAKPNGAKPGYSSTTPAGNTADALIARICAGGGGWHDDLLQLIAHWIGRGWSDAEIFATAAQLTLPGFGVEDTRADMAQMIAGARAKWARPNQPHTLGASPNGLVAVTTRDLLAMQLPPRENLLAPWLPRQGLTMIHAYRGIAKTWVGLACAVALACGGKALKWSAPKPLRVLYGDGEMPATVMQERLRLILGNTGRRGLAEQNLRILTPDLQPGPMPNIATLEGQAALAPHLEGIDVALIDNVATLAAVADDNAVDQWAPVQSWALQQRREGRSVVLLHHDGKGGTQRGTSGREDVLDTVIKLSRPDDYEPSEGARFVVTFEKNRGFYGADAASFEARLEHWLTPDGDRVRWEITDSDNDQLGQVVELLQAGRSLRQIAAELGTSKTRVGRLRGRAVKKGLISVPEGCPT
jgi:hypothetical protein